MKKLLFLLFFISIIYSIHADDIIINQVENTSELKGSDYFPLFIGAKWVWDIKGLGNINRITWEIVSLHKITDPFNNLINKEAFKMKMYFTVDGKDFDDAWYVLENDGYICFYKSKSTGYYLEKIIPVNPVKKDTWNNGSTNYEIVESKLNTIKVESVNDEINKYGYQMFIKDVGPYEIFEYLTVGNKKEDMMMSLVDHVAYQNIYNNEEKEVTKKDDSANDNLTKDNEEKIDDMIDELTDEVLKKNEESEDENITIENTNMDLIPDYVESLKDDKSYIQLGSFNVGFYAEDLMKKASNAGFNSIIYKEQDGSYKVLVEVEKDDSSSIMEIKDKLVRDAFYKKR